MFHDEAFQQLLRDKTRVKNGSLAYRHYQRLYLTRRLTELIVGMLLIYGGQSFLVANHLEVPLTPAMGVGLSAIFLRGYFLLVPIFLGSLLCTPLVPSLLFTLSLFLIRYSCLKWVGPITPLANLRAWISFVMISAMGCLLLWPNTITALNGILCLTPLCLAFEPFTPTRFFRGRFQLWWLVSLFILGLYLVFGCQPALGVLVLGYAFMFGKIPTTVLLLAISVIYFAFANTLTQTLTLTGLALSSITIAIWRTKGTRD